MTRRTVTRRTGFQILTFLVLSLATGSLAWAQSGDDVTYPVNQPTKSWQTRGGNFSITGKAIRRQGNYVEFRTNQKLEIWLPIRYLTPTDLSLLEEMKEGSVPLVSSNTDSGTTPGGFGGMPANDNNATDTSEKPDEKTESVTETKPPIVRPETYATGEYIEVDFNDKWFRGRVIGVNRAKRRYFVSFQDGPIPRSVWFEHDKTRPLPEEESADDADGSTDGDDPS